MKRAKYEKKPPNTIKKKKKKKKKKQRAKTPPQRCKRLTASYCSRLIAVVTAKGGATSY